MVPQDYAIMQFKPNFCFHLRTAGQSQGEVGLNEILQSAPIPTWERCVFWCLWSYDHLWITSYSTNYVVFFLDGFWCHEGHEMWLKASEKKRVKRSIKNLHAHHTYVFVYFLYDLISQLCTQTHNILLIRMMHVNITLQSTESWTLSVI